MSSTGLASNPAEYRERLAEQSDEQLDAWSAELMRDVAVRRGVVKVVADVQRTAHLDEAGFRRVYARGGGPPAMVGHDGQGHLVVPAITLYCVVSGLRAEVPDARERVIEYLVANFEELVYV